MWTLARIVAALAIVCASVAVTPVADAQQRGRGRAQQQRHSRGRGRGQRGPDYNPIPGIIGGIFGGWLAGKARNEEEDGHESMKEGRLEPFSPEWMTACENKYKSFDPKTGYYTSLPLFTKRFCNVEDE